MYFQSARTIAFWFRAFVYLLLCLALTCSFFLRQGALAEQSLNTGSDSKPQLTELQLNYRHLHANPELAKDEKESCKFIKSKLKAYGFEKFYELEQLPTAVITELSGRKPGPVICLRADMDARRCREKTGLAFASVKPELMHNCGHDAHSAILLETARRLALSPEKIRGKIIFLFQPAEEAAGGADDIVKDGLLERLKVRYIFAQHCAALLPVGKFSLASGPCLASSNSLKIVLKGKGGHAAQAQERDDLTRLAALLALELESLPSRCCDPINYPAVCAITNISSGSSQTNVAADEYLIAGTIRSFFDLNDKLFRGKSFVELLKQLVDGLSAAYGVQSTLELKEAVPVTVNDPGLAEKMSKLLTQAGIALSKQEKGMFAEDFAFYTKSIPACYFGLGIAKDGRGMEPPHSAQFTLHEDALENGVGLFETIAHSFQE